MFIYISRQKILLTEELFLYNIGCKYVKKEKTNILYLKILKKSDETNLTRFNTVESNIFFFIYLHFHSQKQEKGFTKS